MNKLLLALVFICSSCGMNKDPNQDFDNRVNEQSFVLAKQYNFQPLGIGGFNENGIKGYTYMFNFISNGDEISARKLLVSFVEDLVNNVNNLGDKLLSFKNFDIYIFFVSPGNLYPNTLDHGLAEVRLIKGDVGFAISKKGTLDLETIHMEPYTEAYEKVTGRKYHPSRVEANE